METMLDKLADVCSVCALPAHGIHFGVVACRACAAFYRRIVVLDLKYKCLQDKKRCNVAGGGRNVCRHCRYQKCIGLGMTTDNVQWNRDSHTSVVGRNKKLKMILKSPKVEEECSVFKPPLPRIPKDPAPKMEVDDYGTASNCSPSSTSYFSPQDPTPSADKFMCGLINMIKTTLDEFRPPFEDDGYRELNSLQRMLFCLEKQRTFQRPVNKLHLVKAIDIYGVPCYWEKEAKKAATWLMHSDVLRALPLEEKFSLFKVYWLIWDRLERCHMSIAMLGERCVREKVVILCEEHMVNFDQVVVTAGDTQPPASEFLKERFKQIGHRIVNEVAAQMTDLNLAPLEVVYMLCQVICYNEDALPQQTITACEQFSEDVASNLHDYYVNECCMPNYAFRIVQIMKVVNAMKKIQFDRVRFMEINKLFNAYKSNDDQGLFSY